MQAIILAAGYATRLYPLTENTPKALLSVGGTTLLDHLVDGIRSISEIGKITVVTNNKFAQHFEQWAQKRGDADIAILNDGTDENGTRLGAIGDMRFTVDSLGIDEDCLVVAGDNYLRIDFPQYYQHYLTVGRRPLLLAEKTDDLDMLRRFAVASVDSDSRVTALIEKPEQPENDLAVYALYLYPRECMRMLGDYLASGRPYDAPGHFAQWLSERMPVYIHIADGPCYDVGTHESLALVRELYGQ